MHNALLIFEWILTKSLQLDIFTIYLLFTAETNLFVYVQHVRDCSQWWWSCLHCICSKNCLKFSHLLHFRQYCNHGLRMIKPPATKGKSGISVFPQSLSFTPSILHAFNHISIMPPDLTCPYFLFTDLQYKIDSHSKHRLTK